MQTLGADEADCTGGTECSDKYEVAVTGDASKTKKREKFCN